MIATCVQSKVLTLHEFRAWSLPSIPSGSAHSDTFGDYPNWSHALSKIMQQHRSRTSQASHVSTTKDEGYLRKGLALPGTHYDGTEASEMLVKR